MSSDDSTEATIWQEEDPANGAGELVPHVGDILQVEKTRRGVRLVVRTNDGALEILDDAGKKVATATPVPADFANYADLSPDGRYLLSCDSDDKGSPVLTSLLLWDTTTGQRIGSPLPQADSTQFSPDGQRLLLVNGDSHQVYESSSGKALGSFSHKGTTTVFSRDGRLLITGYSSGAQIWEAATGKLGKTLEHAGHVNDADFSPDGRRVVTGSNDRTAQVWEVSTGKKSGNRMEHGGDVLSVLFSPDGRKVLTATRNNLVQVWNSETGERLGAGLHHDDKVKSWAFSPDGQMVLTVTAKAAQVWDAKTGRAIGEPMTQAKEILFAGLSPGGRRVMTASSEDGEVRTFRILLGSGDAKDNELLAELAEVVGGYHLNSRTDSVEVIEPKERYARMQKLRAKYKIPDGEDFLQSFIELLSAPAS